MPLSCSYHPEFFQFGDQNQCQLSLVAPNCMQKIIQLEQENLSHHNSLNEEEFIQERLCLFNQQQDSYVDLVALYMDNFVRSDLQVLINDDFENDNVDFQQQVIFCFFKRLLFTTFL